jgi:hypothetical protein
MVNLFEARLSSPYTRPQTPQRWMGWVVNAIPRPLYPRERPGTHCMGGWVSRGQVQKISPSPGFNPQTVQPVASRYADCVIPVYTV